MNNAGIRELLNHVAVMLCRQDATTKRQRWEVWLLAVLIVGGALVRFWGLGATGLHREDEDTTALPALHILVDGLPLFPSGMFYARAIVQSYLIAGSVWLFGDSEWSLRLPSALCGLLLIVLAWKIGRRFLTPVSNAAFTAIVAFLPALILLSQTARMYIFVLACIAAFIVCIIEWERSDSASWLVAGVIILVIGEQFHTLAVLSAFFVYFPAMTTASVKRLWQASAAFITIVAAYYFITEWAGSYYPTYALDYISSVEPEGPSKRGEVPALPLAAVALGVLCALLVAWWASATVRPGLSAWFSRLLLFAALVSQLLMFYHIAALLLLIGVIVLRRGSGAPIAARLLPAGVVSLLILAAHAFVLRNAGIDSLRNIVGVLAATPSLWSYVRVAEHSVAGAAICAIGLLMALSALARRQRIPDVWLAVFLLGWLPLLLIGVVEWNPAPRYTYGALLAVLLGACAVLQDLGGRLKLAGAVVAAVGTVLMINPLSFARSVNSGYDVHPDHKGAAEYIRSIALSDNDIVIAEDVIVQAYYLDRLDYWMVDFKQALNFARNVDGVLRDIYAGRMIIGSAEQLVSVIDQADRGDIYIIGSGENQSDGRLTMRGEGLHRTMESAAFSVVYVGRDGLTKVWKIPAGSRGWQLIPQLPNEDSRQ